MTKIIFVCHGNICRSPMAEFVFRHLAKELGREDDFEISSAAVSYEEEGNGLYPYAADTLRRHGIPFGHHRAHRITKQEYEEADLMWQILGTQAISSRHIPISCADAVPSYIHCNIQSICSEKVRKVTNYWEL